MYNEYTDNDCKHFKNLFGKIDDEFNLTKTFRQYIKTNIY